MDIEKNKTLVRRIVEARNTNNVEAFVAPFPSDWSDKVRRAFTSVTEAFPDVHITINELIGEGNKVVSYWSFQGTHLGLYQNISATGNTVNYTGIDIYTIEEGKIIAAVRVVDNLVVLQQLGVAPSNQQKATL